MTMTQVCTGFEPVLLFSTKELKKSVIKFGHGKTSQTETTENIYTRSNDVSTLRKIMNVQLKLE